MSIVEIRVPQFSESVSAGTLQSWKKKVGEAVSQDETLVEVETDKVVMEVPAPVAGVLVAIEQSAGATVQSEQLLAKIDTAAAESVSTVPVAAPATVPTVSAATAKAVVMPAAARLMTENHMNASQVTGTGKGGRITKGDVLQTLASGSTSTGTVMAADVRPRALAQVTASVVPADELADRPIERVPMSRLRARIAERLLQSQATNAILTTFNEVNMASILEIRKRCQERFEKEHGVKLGFMSFFVKAAVYALQRYPLLNASIDGNDIVYHGYFDIGIAVGSPRGLVVPILRNADQMRFAEIEKKIADYGAKAREGKLGLDEMTGGTFSISNGGVFGSMLSTPIINPPQSAILGVHATKDRAVVENGQIVIRPMNYLAMSYDHRIIDGREAVLGLVAMKESLEDPTRLLFDI